MECGHDRLTAANTRPCACSKVVGDRVGFSKPTAEPQRHGQQVQGGERRPAALLRASIDLLGIFQATGSVELERMIEEGKLGRVKLERLLGFGIAQDIADERRRIGGLGNIH